MKDLAALFIMAIPAIACVISAFAMAFNSIDGWGWFLFVGVLVSVQKFKVD